MASRDADWSSEARETARVILDHIAARSRASKYREVRTRFTGCNDALLAEAHNRFGVVAPFGGPTSSGMLTLHCPPMHLYALGSFLREHGAEYVCDWVNDDLPYRMNNGLYSIPYSIELNDMPLFNNPSISIADFERRIIDAFDVLYAEGERSGRVLGIALHPFLIGTPHRIRYLDRALKHIVSHDRVWLATGAEISYTKLARGPIDARATLAGAEDLLATLDAEGKVVFPVEVALTDGAGETVATAVVRWHVSKTS